MKALPSLFLAHGAPNLPLGDHVAKHFLGSLGERLPRPKAILIISAHWETETPTLGTSKYPDTIYDFGGFSPELYRLRYPAGTDGNLVDRTEALLTEAGHRVVRDATRGYDHGVWVPLMLAYPKADLPVVQLSLQRGGDGNRHFAIGRALAPLRTEGVLIVGSGATVHILRTMSAEGSPTPDWARRFDDRVDRAVTAGDHAALANFQNETEGVHRAHPTPEHFMPLFVAMGAGGHAARARRIHHSFSHGTIGMACYAFGTRSEITGLDMESAA